jgi:hypothetical protein
MPPDAVSNPAGGPTRAPSLDAPALTGAQLAALAADPAMLP